MAKNETAPNPFRFRYTRGRRRIIMKTLSVLLLLALVLPAAEKVAPKEKIVFTAKPGNVSFDHATHLKAMNG